MAKLLENTISRIKVPEGKRDILVFDDALPGFGIRKFASGKASFFVKYQVASQQRKITLGPVVPGVTAEMRRKASDILAKARVGQDVAGEKKEARAKKAATVGDLVQKYLAVRQNELSSVYYIEITRYLERSWKPLHSHGIEAIQRRDIVARLDEIAADHGKVAADRAKDAISTFFAWAIDKSYIDASPIHHIKKRAKAGSRTRVLSEAELADVWNACAEDDYGRIVRLLILTGQRKSEVSDLAWHEIDLQKKQIELPSKRTKNRLPQIVPLSDEALSIIRQVPARHDREHVFGDGHRGFQGWSRAKESFDARITTTRKELEKKPLPDWTLHDIRRSVNTHLNENGIAQPHIIEAILNHVSGHKADIAGVYNKAQYL
ncbi:MAG: site-specific integrase, partial [Rhodomicrobium sp.]|nr:site-specific integrase [Rhodomicrobium sp.]